jgi:DNA-directed RNA polymerase subunit RPC12/RpoP
VSEEELKEKGFPCSRCGAKTLGMRRISYYKNLKEGKVEEVLCENCSVARKEKQAAYWVFPICGVVPELL